MAPVADPGLGPEPTRDRFDRVAAAFGVVADAVPDDGWDRPAPCEGWVARDVVDHLVAWVPSAFDRSEIVFADTSDVSDPAERWASLSSTLRSALASPRVAGREFDVGPPGRMTVESAIGMLVVGDVLVHTWDLAVATGQRVDLDAATVHDLYLGMLSMDEALRASGHFGPAIEVPEGSDETTRLLAFSGRDVTKWS